jgi:hypothetical protein
VIFITPCKPKAQLGVSGGAERHAVRGWGIRERKPARQTDGENSKNGVPRGMYGQRKTEKQTIKKSGRPIFEQSLPFPSQSNLFIVV